LLWQLFTPHGTRVYALSPGNFLLRDKLSKENWWHNEYGIGVIYNEFVKMGVIKRFNK
jgi:hypothetical protein